MSKKQAQLVAALDVTLLEELRVLLDKVEESVDVFKVGSQLFTSCGPAAVRFLQARGKKVFLDLKYHDIPNTVANAVDAATRLSVAVERNQDFYDRKPVKSTGLFMYTLHTCGGLEMMKAAVEAAKKASEDIGVMKPMAVGVTVLTSEQKQDNILDLVLQRADTAKKAGLDGVVASCHESKFIRKEFGNDFIIVTPGIRPVGSDAQDQQRIATPQQAVKNGSDFLVVGRPIVKAEDPGSAARKILKEIRDVV